MGNGVITDQPQMPSSIALEFDKTWVELSGFEYNGPYRVVWSDDDQSHIERCHTHYPSVSLYSRISTWPPISGSLSEPLNTQSRNNVAEVHWPSHLSTSCSKGGTPASTSSFLSPHSGILTKGAD